MLLPLNLVKAQVIPQAGRPLRSSTNLPARTPGYADVRITLARLPQRIKTQEALILTSQTCTGGSLSQRHCARGADCKTEAGQFLTMHI